MIDSHVNSRVTFTNTNCSCTLYTHTCNTYDTWSKIELKVKKSFLWNRIHTRKRLTKLYRDRYGVCTSISQLWKVKWDTNLCITLKKIHQRPYRKLFCRTLLSLSLSHSLSVLLWKFNDLSVYFVRLSHHSHA